MTDTSASPKWRHLRKVFAIDLRSLALFRVAIAGILLSDLLWRWSAIRMLYTDQGLLPREGLLERYGPSIQWTTLHYYTGSTVLTQSVMFMVATLAAIALLVGYRTFLATLVSWLLLISLNARVPHMAANGGDMLLRMLLLWSMFLPLGARWAVDSTRNPDASSIPKTICSAATVAILLQVCYVYWFTAIMKITPSWLDGSAVGAAMHLDFHTRPLGKWLSQQPQLTHVLTYATLVGEAVLPILAVSPIRNSLGRWLCILGMWGLHLGIALCMSIGLFPFISMISWLVFVPSSTWDTMSAWCQTPAANGTRSYYDALCRAGGRARHGMSFLTRWLPLPSKPTIVPSTALSWLVAGLLAFVTLFNILGINQLNARGIRAPTVMRRLASLLRIEQKWNMFALQKEVLDGWYMMPARLRDGSTIDIFTGNPITYAKPKSVVALYSNHYIREMFYRHRGEPESPLWKWVARYYSRDWNAKHPDQPIDRMQIVFMAENEAESKRAPYPMIEFDATEETSVEVSPAPIGYIQ